MAYALLEESLRDAGFIVNKGKTSIHGEDNVKFSKQVLKADKWVLNILETGLKLNFVSMPPSYEQRNNKSASSNMTKVLEKVKEWETAGSITRVSEKPYCINPLSFVSKVDSLTGQCKERVVIDQSRGPNLHITDEKCKLEGLEQCETLLEQGDYQCILDLENMFFHVSLAEQEKKYFGFAVPDNQGKNIYYIFNVLAFGCKCAVNVVTRLLKPAKAFVHKLGIRFSLFIDDGRVLGQAKDECWFKFQAVLLVLQLQGWNIQWSKTSTEPTQVVKYLGFQTDTVRMKYYCDEDKLEIIRQVIIQAIDRINKGKIFKAREVAQVLGKIHSLHTSHGNVVYMCRSAQQALGRAVMREDWDTSLYMDGRVAQEFKYILNNLNYFNGKIIARAPGASLIVEHTAMVNALARIKEGDVIQEPVFVSDASEEVAYIFAKNNISVALDFVFTEKERDYSSGHRELLAILKTLQSQLDYFRGFQGQKIYWQTDSQNTVIFLTKGSRKEKIHKDVLKIKTIERMLDIIIHPVWTPRSHVDIKVADRGSKLHMSSDEFCIDKSSLESVCSILDIFPTVDCMASSKNFRFANFFSVIPQNGSAGVNFYAQSLNSHSVYYCCPPVGEIVTVLRKFFSEKSFRLLFIIPFWPSAIFWPFLLNGSVFKEEIIQAVVFKPLISSFTDKPTIFEKGSFEFVALKIVKS